MRTNYVLIDFENVQIQDIEALDRENIRVLVFVGSLQKKVGLDVACALQKMGQRAEYIQIAGNGPNALDFHIAFYVGKLSSVDANAFFHIVSKDSGFDPLIEHLKGKKVLVKRVHSTAEIPSPKVTTLAEKVKVSWETLEKRGQARPKMLKTLANTIATVLQAAAGSSEVSQVVEELEKKGLIKVEDEKVVYKTPSDKLPTKSR